MKTIRRKKNTAKLPTGLHECVYKSFIIINLFKDDLFVHQNSSGKMKEKKNRLKVKEKKIRLYFALLESFKVSLYGKFMKQ